MISQADEQVGGASLYFLNKENRMNNPHGMVKGLRRSADTRTEERSEDDMTGGAQRMRRVQTRDPNERYRPVNRPDVEKMGSYEIQERMLKYPLSKNELVDYLVRLQHGSSKFSKSTYKRLMQHPNFKEILDEVQN